MKTILVLSFLLTACAPRIEAAQTFRVYLPMVTRPPGLYGAGVASTAGGAFNDLLGATWFYTWSFCDAPCVPMSRNWDLPSKCYPVLMLGNEPNTVEPFGHTELPEQAAAISQTIRARCPKTWLVVGNVALPQFGEMSGIMWVQRYIAAGGKSDQLGAHCYAIPNGTSERCTKALGDFAAAFPRAPICVTEFGTFNKNPETFREMLIYIQNHFNCFAAFTDRDQNWVVYGENLNMVNADGTLNESGRIYQERVR